MIKKKYLVYSICIVFMLFASFYDLKIDQYLYDPNNLFGLFFQNYVLNIIYLILPFTIMSFYRIHKKSIYLCLSFLACFYLAYPLRNYVPLNNEILKVSILAIVIMMVIAFFVKIMPLKFLKDYEKVGMLFCLLLLTSTILINIIKPFWGRVRFRQMEDITQFTAWFLPQGFTGYYSFPSGHTAMASTILCLCAIPDYVPEKRTNKKIYVILSFSFIILMGLSRMIVGAHFLSDVTAGFLVTYTLYLLLRKQFRRWEKTQWL
ncbi:MAG: phosphatase PAP2 family protein [Erysipelotrichaceae bacterium]